MKQQFDRDFEITYVTDKNGNIDMNYYISKAHQLRSEAVRAQTNDLVDAVKRGFASLTAVIANPKTA